MPPRFAGQGTAFARHKRRGTSLACCVGQIRYYFPLPAGNSLPGGTIKCNLGIVDFSIVTPSFRNSKWLKLCIASVADQDGVTLEHIVQDAGSDDGTLDWLPQDERVQVHVEKDNGMYDAVNRGFRRSTENSWPI